MKHPLLIKFIKRNNKLEYKDPQQELLVKKLITEMRENQVIDTIMDFTGDDGKLWQISRVHGLIKRIADFIGDTPSSVKIEVKKRAGLYTITDELKSFGDCSKEELNLAIEECIGLGDHVGINLR